MRNIAVTVILSYLRFLARIALQLNHPRVIGITGSVGKSSCRAAVQAMLKGNMSVYVIEEGNSETGIPLGILGLAPTDYGALDWIKMLVKAPFGLSFLQGYDYVVIEMGIDEPDPPKNMAYLLTIVKPDISLFLNVFPVHTLQFDKTVPASVTGAERLQAIQRNIAKEKGRIITDSGCKIAIYNSDNPFVREVISQYRPQAHEKVEFVGVGSEVGNAITFKSYHPGRTGTEFVFSENKLGDVTINIPGYALPLEYREIIGITVALGRSLGIEDSKIKASLETNFHLPPGRMSVFPGIRNALIIDSSYNASRASVLAAVRMARAIADQEHKPLVFLFGDMRELGEESQPEHEAVAAELLTAVDYLYCVGPMTYKYVMPAADGKLKATKWFNTAVSAGSYIKDNLPDGAIVLVKGSQNEIFLEEAVKQLLESSADSSKLCRQDEGWMRRKQNFIAS